MKKKVKSGKNKSKGGNKAKGKGKKGTGTRPPIDTDAATTGLLSMDINKDPPENGWIYEKEESVKALKSERNEVNILRLAHALHKLRQWKKLEDLASPELELETESSVSSSLDDKEKLKYREQLRAFHREARDHLAVKTQWDQQMIEAEVYDNNMDMDEVMHEHVSFNNLNILHCAALSGDVRMLESAIAMGAAIDYPVKEPLDEFKVRGQPYATGATPLLIALSTMAMYAMLPKHHYRAITSQDPRILEVMKGSLECAVQLVKLGANCNVVLRLRGTVPMMQSMGLDNKSALQLINIVNKVELNRAVKQVKSKEDKIRFVHCRCGSRLPWKECHAAFDQEPHYSEENKENVLGWRYSPLAKCFCKYAKKKKTHYKCCWQDEARYQNDSSGQLFGIRKIRIDDGNRDFLEPLIKMKEESTDPNGLVFPQLQNMSREKIFAGFRSFPKDEWMKMWKSGDPDGISALKNMDMDVYVGIMERIENWFQWNDLHWMIPKTELIQRAKEWNDALSQYCDDMGLTGEEREQLVKIHLASPLARCGNPTCDEFEVKVKGFAKCSRCNRIAYCSRSCQAQHWKSHKKRCMAV